MEEKLLCPYCNAKLTLGVLKCKHCGEFIDKKNDTKEIKIDEKENEKKKTSRNTRGCLTLIIVSFIAVAIIGSGSNNSSDTTQVQENPIQKQFSVWDGRHINLTYFIKDNMKDPSSFEHISSTYVDKGDYLIVTETYRGKNSFGALVPNTIIAKVDMSGNILKILNN